MKKNKFIFPLILLVHLLLLLHLRFIAWPEMILWPYLLDKGLLLYRDIVVIYPPGLIVLLAFLGKIFGATLWSLKIYTWVLIILTDFLIYWITKKLTEKEKVALIALIFYVLWQPYFEGNALWFDLVLAPLALLAFYFLFAKKYFWSGVFFGLALAIKQTAGYFIFPIFLTFWLLKGLGWKTVFRFILGSVIPLVYVLFYLVQNNLILDFYQWAVSFGVFYLPRATGQIQAPTIKNLLAVSVPYALLIPFLVTILQRRNIVNEGRQVLILLFLWCGFAVLGIIPRWEYFHFQPSLSFLAIISGISISSINISSKKWSLYFGIYLLLIVLGTIYLQGRFYRLNWQKEARFFDSQTLGLAAWIRNHTKPSEKIYILNCWDHLYAFSDTLPAVSPLIHTLPWHLEYPGMQEKYVSDLNKIKPNLVVFCPYSETGLGSYKPAKIDQFLKDDYKQARIIEERVIILEPKSK